MKMEQKPWVDEKGNVLSDEKLLAMKDSWDLETWEEFLKSEVEVRRQEALLETSDYIDSCDTGYAEIVRESAFREQFPLLEQQVKRYLKHLTIREQEILKALFWEGRSQREIAKVYDVSRAAITNTRDRALKKLGMLFIDNVLSSKVFLGEKKEGGHPNRDQKAVGRKDNSDSVADAS